MTRRRSSYRSLASLQRDNRVCRACAEAGYPLESLPIVQPYTGQRAYVFGQAPGAQEGNEGNGDDAERSRNGHRVVVFVGSVV